MKHKDIGKRVRDRYGVTGILLAIDCDATTLPNLIQRDDIGWTLKSTYITANYKEARKQGVKDGTKNLCWIDGYTIIDEPQRPIIHIYDNEPILSTGITFKEQIKKPNNKLMLTIKSMFRDLTLSKDDKIMKRLELENPAGVPTPEGLDLFMEWLYTENRKAFIEVVKKLDVKEEE